MEDSRKRSWLKNWKETPIEDTYVSGLEPKEQYTPYFDLGVDVNEETSVSTGPSQDVRNVSCIDSNGCAAGWACRGGFCVQNNTDDSSTSGGCGSGGTGTFLPGDDFGCIEISGGAGGGGGCTTGTCGSDGSGGAGGGAEYCCGDWVCEKNLNTGELECKCIYVDPGTCGSDEDCPEGYTCSDGYCFFDYCECESNGDCPEGYSCSGCFCLFDYDFQSCTSDADCPEGYECYGDFCYPDYGCQNDAECPDGKACFGGFCIPGCDEESPCPSGLQCVNGFCSNSCTDDSQCPDGQICLGGFCFYGCRGTEDCPSGYECSNGFCFPVFESCDGDYNCNSQEQCINGFCFPGPPTCSAEDLEGCLRNEVCIDGFCIPEVDLDFCGFLDFNDCGSIQLAKENPGCKYTVEEGGYFTLCGDGRVDCFEVDLDGVYKGEVVNTDKLYYSNWGTTYVWVDIGGYGYWKQANCDKTESGAGPNPPTPPSPPSPPGDGGPKCNERCQERAEAGVAGEECDGVPICGDCEQCNREGRCEKYEPGAAPCWCQDGEQCRSCEQCDKASGGCISALDQCQECCTVSVTCAGGEDVQGECCFPIEPGSKTYGETCQARCKKKLLEKCPPPNPTPCSNCTGYSRCGEGASCDPGDKNTGSITAGGETCVVCLKCDDEDSDCGPEPCDCNCEDDCPECFVCNAAGKCEPDPACDDCCPEGAPPGSKCVQEQQIGVYRGGKENGYIFAVYRTNCGGWSISQTELGFWQVNFTSPCGVPVTGGGFSTDDLIDVEPLTACSEKICGPCGCDRYANGGSTAYC